MTDFTNKPLGTPADPAPRPETRASRATPPPMEPPHEGDAPGGGGIPRDELDALLRDWHEESAATARARRDALLAKALETRGPDALGAARRHGAVRWHRVHRLFLSPGLRAAALIAVGALAVILLTLMPSRDAFAADRVAQMPEGGRLDAVDRDGTLIGPCPLEHTDVNAEISGFISRVTVTQKYRNTYAQKIEAVYTFPLSHRAAVDRMRMIVRERGEERIIEGEVKERTLAREIYESARRAGFVASLLEQERPNIFTQSVANIEPGAEVLVEISYVETLAMRDGRFIFDFPMVVGPRYIPGSGPQPTEGRVPQGLTVRRGVILLAPAQVRIDAEEPGMMRSADAVLSAINHAVPIMPPSEAWIDSKAHRSSELMAIFTVRYPDGSEEPGTLRADGTGEVAGRWFFCPPRPGGDRPARGGAGFAQGTDQVPDAGRITPMPVRPPERAGHDLSMRVSIDTGGPAVTNVRSELHRVDVREPQPSRAVITLEQGRTIPNRDFALSWSLAGGELAEGVLTQHIPGRDGYFLLYLVPPARAETAVVRPRELIFVLDTSGSMNGFPIEKSKELMTRMLGEMRPEDSFNIITFAGDHQVLWPAPRPATPENLKMAQDFVQSRRSSGGTEMMKAIEAALKPSPAPGVAGGAGDIARANDGDRAGEPGASTGSRAAPMRLALFLTDGYVGNDMAIIDAVRRHAGTTRVFAFGIGDSVNRYLLAEMARAGRGAADFIHLASDADEAVERFSQRVRTPVLTDLSISFDGLETAHVTPSADALPDLFDREPLVIAGRYTAPGRGVIRLRGMTAQGPWERALDAAFPEGTGSSTVVAPMWARLQVDDILRPHLNALQQGAVPREIREMVVRLAERHSIMSPFTSFVAVEKTRVTLGGQAVLVPVPIELPRGVNWEGNFGSAGEVLQRLAPLVERHAGHALAREPGGALAFNAKNDSGVTSPRDLRSRQANMESTQGPAERRSGGLSGAPSAPVGAGSPGGAALAARGDAKHGRLLKPPVESATPAATAAPGAVLAPSSSPAPPATGAPPSPAWQRASPPAPSSAPAPEGRSGAALPVSEDRGATKEVTASAPDRRTDAIRDAGASTRVNSELESTIRSRPTHGFTGEQLNQIEATLDRELFLMAIIAEAKRELEAAADTAPGQDVAPLAAPLHAAVPSEALRVVARFKTIDDALERALTAMGIEIEGRAAHRQVLVLRVPADRLLDLAQLEGIVRVERVEMNPAPSR